MIRIRIRRRIRSKKLRLDFRHRILYYRPQKSHISHILLLLKKQRRYRI